MILKKIKKFLSNLGSKISILLDQLSLSCNNKEVHKIALEISLDLYELVLINQNESKLVHIDINQLCFSLIVNCCC
jgi:hypothetical protein